jgi:hypothetical protein
MLLTLQAELFGAPGHVTWDAEDQVLLAYVPLNGLRRWCRGLGCTPRRQQSNARWNGCLVTVFSM